MTKRVTFQSKLKSYLVFAGSFAAANSASSQVIYTDVIPDDTLFVTNFYALDLNGSGGFPDFGAFIGSSSGFQSAVLAPFLSSYNWVAGHVDSAGIYFVSAFNSGQLIGPALNWYSDQSYMFLVSPVGQGDWINVTDKFGGLKIMDGGNQYYGWIRMDVQKQPLRVIVKDYAYNATPGQPIVAGTAVPVNEVSSDDFVKIAVNGKMLFVNNTLTNDESRAMVFNAIGELVIDNTLAHGINQIDCSLCVEGIYFLKVTSGKKILTQKLFLR